MKKKNKPKYIQISISANFQQIIYENGETKQFDKLEDAIKEFLEEINI